MAHAPELKRPGHAPKAGACPPCPSALPRALCLLGSGALWTAPTGLLLYVLGYGSLPLLSGTCMGIWYVAMPYWPPWLKLVVSHLTP